MRDGYWDTRVFYDPKGNRIVIVAADIAVDGVRWWWHYDGRGSWHVKGKLTIAPEWVLVGREPEGML